MTKEARKNTALNVKASHFQLGFVKNDINEIEKSKNDEALKQKWQPQKAQKSASLARSNFSIGQTNVFNDQTSAKSDFP